MLTMVPLLRPTMDHPDANCSTITTYLPTTVIALLQIIISSLDGIQLPFCWELTAQSQRLFMSSGLIPWADQAQSAIKESHFELLVLVLLHGAIVALGQ